MNHSKFYIAPTIVVLFSSVVFAQQVPMPAPGVEIPFAQNPRVLRQKKHVEDSKEMLKIAGTVAPSISESTVKIVSGKREIALGTIVTPEGHILTKAGNLKTGAKVVVAGQEYVPQIVGIHQGTDLALLKIDAGELPAVELAQVGELQKGSWLISIGPGKEAIAMGVFAGQLKKLGGSMGVMLTAVDEGAIQRVRVIKVIPRSAADRADLWVNDVIRSIDGVEVTSIPQLIALLGTKRPFDQIELTFVRGDKELTIPLELGESSLATTSRRLYFEHAIQHDSKLSRNQCGGPVVSLTGQIVGINILEPALGPKNLALAIPINEAIPIIELLKSGDLAPSAVNQERIKWLVQKSTEVSDDLSGLSKQQGELSKQLGELAASIREYQEIIQRQQDLEQALRLVRRKSQELQRQLEKVEDELERLRRGFGN